MADILLTTLNARYIHSSLGLRYLLANLGELQNKTHIREFTIDQRPIDVAEKLLAERPRIIGLGVYIWNVEQSRQLVEIVKQVAPEVIVILGGPEVSFEWQAQPWLQQADYVIGGYADLAFARLCRDILAGTTPTERFLSAPMPRLAQLTLPYDGYNDEDIAHRLIYVEASRGCPFKCEFCLSALDKTAWAYDLNLFLAAMDRLYQRGVRHFKFVDRTFNLKIDHTRRILEFFLQRMDSELFLHFELIPDHLPEELKELIARFPEHSLQFEIGVQSLNPAVQTLISRKQNNEKSLENIRWIREHSHAHIHADLIIGLPGEDLTSLALGFDQLWAVRPHEIQVGILKRLRGTPIVRHTNEFAMRYNPSAPYNILSNRDIDFTTMQRLTRFARYWDMIANAGRFPNMLPVILGDTPFDRFMQLSDWLYAQTGQTHRIALPRLFELIYQAMRDCLAVDETIARQVISDDFARTDYKHLPKSIQDQGENGEKNRRATGSSQLSRQARHL